MFSPQKIEQALLFYPSSSGWSAALSLKISSMLASSGEMLLI
jgi:hypothetical protein